MKESTEVFSSGGECTETQGWGKFIASDSAIVNLAGVTTAHWRWTQSYHTRILESRVHAGQAIERYGPPAVLVQASASGYYGDRGQKLLTEASPPGQGFRAKVCQGASIYYKKGEIAGYVRPEETSRTFKTFGMFPMTQPFAGLYSFTGW